MWSNEKSSPVVNFGQRCITLLLAKLWLGLWTCNQQVAGLTLHCHAFLPWPWTSCSHMCASVTRQVNLVLAEGGDIVWLDGSLWPFVTDSRGITSYGLKVLRKGDEHPTNASHSMIDFTFYCAVCWQRDVEMFSFNTEIILRSCVSVHDNYFNLFSFCNHIMPGILMLSVILIHINFLFPY